MRAALFVFLLGHLAYGQNLDRYLWKNRVGVIFKTVDNNPEVKEQLEAFKPFSGEILDREMVILVPGKAESPKLLKRLALDNEYSGLVLLGKDGGIKLKQKLVVKPHILFDLVDAMPMRRAELRDRSKKPD